MVQSHQTPEGTQGRSPMSTGSVGSVSVRSPISSDNRRKTGEGLCLWRVGKVAVRSQWSLHTRGHTQGRSPMFVECDQSFSEKSVVISHQRTHTGEKPYVCRE
ncbi:unnamed protein product [Rangifer tarandus platyrhynchus]|uniref:C2H2-type domain-containing protein n=3 Tax=Rangifer tarandus platyrhynchus TaxID=3082113 RepID=A0ABN8XK15_RANTA|nr:unnamed protein product [Rangifer tarandus platyrhynchus]